MTRVKVCGVTSVADALQAVEAGADAIGLNFFERSPRYLSESAARLIVEAIAGRALCVGVFVDMAEDAVAHVRDEVGLDCVQLHGDETPELVARFLPHAYKALRVRGPSVLAEAARYPGEHILLDAYVPGEPGGTGARFDWSLAAELSRTRKVTLAGGLNPDNVRQAVEQVQPYCVDVATGVERAPGVKDPELVSRLISAVRDA